MNKFKCFYHISDMDGWCSAAIVAMYTGNYDKENYIGIDYNNHKIESIDIDSIKNEVIYIVDLSFTERNIDILRKLNENNEVIWIDHHDASMEINDMYDDIRNIKGIRSKSHSGAYFTWLFLMREYRVPSAVKYVSDWDCFHLKFHDIFAFKYGVDSIAQFKNPLSWQWKDLINGTTAVNVDKLIYRGKTIEQYVNIENEAYCKSNVFESEIDGNKCAVLNKLGNGKLLFGDLYYKYPYVSTFIYDGEKYKYSLYTHDPEKYDCNSIAKKFGGGGHKGAAGFSSKELIYDFKGKIDFK